MKVEIISGNLAGTVQELDSISAQVAIQTGYAKPFVEMAPVSLTESVPDVHTADGPTPEPVVFGLDLSATSDAVAIATELTPVSG